MNKINNFFKFLKDKDGKEPPILYKLLYDQESLTPEDLRVEGDLNLNDTKITSIPKGLEVWGFLDLENTNISSLPDNLTVGTYLGLEDSKIVSLPDNLYVGSGLYIQYTNINSIPNNLKVGGSLYMLDTPLAGRYTKDEIRRIIEDKGGWVKGDIVNH